MFKITNRLVIPSIKINKLRFRNFKLPSETQLFGVTDFLMDPPIKKNLF